MNGQPNPNQRQNKVKASQTNGGKHNLRIEIFESTKHTLESHTNRIGGFSRLGYPPRPILSFNCTRRMYVAYPVVLLTNETESLQTANLPTHKLTCV